MIDWDLVEDRVAEAKGIAFDTCHKIYVLMDDDQMELMKRYEYDPLISKYQMSAEEMFSTVKKWYADSCGLKFIDAVTTNKEDPSAGFESLVPQGVNEHDECYECGEENCDGYECQLERCDRCGDDDIYDEWMCKDCYEDSLEDDNE